MAEPVLDDYEKELVRFFAQRCREHHELVERTELPRHQEVDDHTEAVALNRLDEAELISIFTRSQVKVLPACVELVQAWDNPPLPDYRDKATKWFWSKWWSLPVWLVFVGLPALVGYIVMLKTILEWLGIVKGSPLK